MPITIELTVVVTVVSLFGTIIAALWKVHILAVRFEMLEKQALQRKVDDEKTLKVLLDCLSGLIEQGCDGDVKKMYKELNEYIVESR